MSDDLVAIFARIHADYRSAIAMTVRNLPPEALEAVSQAFSYDAPLPIEGWVVAPRVRIEVRKEIKRRAEAAAQEAEA